MKVNNRKSIGSAAFFKDSENEPPQTAKPPKSKRYSTAFDLKAAASPKSNEEKKQQQIIAELYQDVVKRVQENKLTAKNAFGSRNIIDNLDVVLQLAKGSFHKASCAVSTAAEIYCLEVDDLSATTSLVQEMLFNSDKKRGDLDGEEARANRKGKGDNGSGGANLEACCTLETNLANIRSDLVEAELDIDAQFQKLLQGKDVGVQGMLLNILGVYNGPNLALDCTGVQAFAASATENSERKNANVDVPRDISARPPRIVDCRVGPSLISLREELAKRSSDQSNPQASSSVVESLDPRMSFRSENVKKPDAPRISSSPSKQSAKSPSSSPVSCTQIESSSSSTNGPVEDYEYDDYMDADGGGDYYDDDSGMMPEPAQATSSSPIGSDVSMSQDSKPNALPLIMKAFEAQAMDADSGKVEFFEAPNVQEALEAEAAKSGGKFWVGDLHWKAPRPKADAKANKEEANEKRKLARQKKNERLIDFFGPAPDEKQLLAKPSSQRVNLLPRNSLNKETHTLPKNTHFTVADLKRLFLRPHVLLQAMATTSTSGGIMDGGDEYYGGYNESGGIAAYDDDDDYGGGDDDDDYNEFYDCETSSSSPSKSLVAPAHHVERIRVAYATRAKKVDVKKLKSDLWETIDTLAVPVEDLEREEDEPIKGEISLVGSIQNLAPKEQNDSITVPFYFICMLHLANEHGLELQSSGDLDDIRIIKAC